MACHMRVRAPAQQGLAHRKHRPHVRRLRRFRAVGLHVDRIVHTARACHIRVHTARAILGSTPRVPY
eukprot:60888-Prymnesium_polylepis.1